MHSVAAIRRGERDPAAERDLGGFALKLAKEGNWDFVGNTSTTGRR